MNKNRIFSLLFIFVFILSFSVFAVDAEETISAERLSDIKEIFTDVIKKSENHNFLYGKRDKETFPFYNSYVGNKYSAWFEKFTGTTPVDITSDADLSDENSELLAEYLLNFESGLETIDEIEYEVYYKIPKVYQGINLGVQFGIPDCAITTHEFKADGNISEDQYYDHEATLKEKIRS